MQTHSQTVLRFFKGNELHVENFDLYINTIKDWDKARKYFLPFLNTYLRSINYLNEDFELYETDLELNTYISFINKSIRLRDLIKDEYIGILSCDIFYRLLEDLDRDIRRFNVIELLTDDKYGIVERYVYYKAFSKLVKIPTLEGFDEKFADIMQHYKSIELPKALAEIQRLNNVQAYIDNRTGFSIPQFMHDDQETVVKAMNDGGLGMLVECFDLAPEISDEPSEDDMIEMIMNKIK